jgi:hypothetical protein
MRQRNFGGRKSEEEWMTKERLGYLLSGPKNLRSIRLNAGEEATKR